MPGPAAPAIGHSARLLQKKQTKQSGASAICHCFLGEHTAAVWCYTPLPESVYAYLALVPEIYFGQCLPFRSTLCFYFRAARHSLSYTE